MTFDHQALTDQLSVSGDLAGDWRPAFSSVPRELFIPDGIWIPDGEVLQPVLRKQQPDRWQEHVYSDEYVAIQADDGRTKPGEVGRYLSSSSSMPSVVAMMLSTLELKPHMSVLEIGTGTGWNAGILASRLGDEQVVSIEIDPQVAADARAALDKAGLRPQVVTGDGVEGYSLAAPYDRILATAATQQVPYTWVEQTKMGGLIVTPWGTAYHNGTLLKLRKTEDGASGHFGGNVGFMWLRSQRIPFGSVEDRVKVDHVYEASTTTLYPYEPVSDFDGSFAVGLLVPDCQTAVFQEHEEDPLIVYLMDESSDSWATVTVDSDSNGDYLVHQHGPRRLWEAVENAHAWWVDQGRPEHSRFGLTVIRNRQWVWLDKPTNEVLKSQGVEDCRSPG